MEIEKVEYNNANVKKIVEELHEKNSKVTQISLAKEMGLTVQQMFWHNPTSKNLGIIASVLKVVPNKLFDIKWSYDNEEIKSEVVRDLVPPYTPDDDLTREELYKILYEQQVEITRLMEENAKLLKILNK